MDATRQDNRLRPIAWSFGEGATFPGFTDDTNWNGWIVDVGNTSRSFDHLIDAEAHLWSVFASHQCRYA